MGNCQVIDAATIVIQHPCGRVDKLYWPVNASDIMKMNPGYCVALLLTTTAAAATPSTPDGGGSRPNIVRFTRVKLLRKTDTLVLGHVYRLIATEEVMKGLWERKCAKMKKQQESVKGTETEQKLGSTVEIEKRRLKIDNSNQVAELERQQRTTSTNSATTRSRAWHPSLQSISEAGS